MLLISAILTLSGCSNSNERASINLSIEEYEAKIEEALLMTNGYQDAKYTSAREELDEFLISSRDKYDFELTSPYEGLTLDEALDYYNNLNGTELVNITNQELPEIQKEVEAIEEEQERSRRESLINHIISSEELLEEGNQFAVEGYAKNVIDLGEEGISKYLTYDEAKSLVESGDYYEWWQENKERVVDPEKEAQWKSEIEVSNSSSSNASVSTYKTLELTIDDASTSYGYITVGGSISNPTNNAYSYVELKVKILDTNGKVIDTENTYAVGSETLSPGDTKKWDAMFKADDRADNVEVEIVNYKIK